MQGRAVSTAWAFSRSYEPTGDLTCAGSPALRRWTRGGIEFHFVAFGRAIGEGLEVKIRCHLTCIGTRYGNAAIAVNRVTAIAPVDFVGRTEIDLSAGPRSRRSTQRLIGESVGR